MKRKHELNNVQLSSVQLRIGSSGPRREAALLVVSGNAVHFICLQSLQMSTFLDFQFYYLNMDIDVELPISMYL